MKPFSIVPVFDCSFTRPSSICSAFGLVILMFAGTMATALANRDVLLSVKIIKNSAGTPPSGGVAARSGFDAEVTHGNQVLAATGRGYELAVVEFLYIQPPAPSGQPADYWFSLDARSNRAVFEAAALADKATWLWNDNAINIYINDSASGECSFPHGGFAISLGKTLFPSIGSGSVVHEIGHFFGLRHTHIGDQNNKVDNWGDGDGLVETLPDDPDATLGDINARYPAETQQKRDDLYYNVMSYHAENRLLPVQMDIWDANAADFRMAVCRPRVWWVANFGSDANSGADPNFPAATLSHGLLGAATSLGPVHDDIMLNGGTYVAPTGGVISTPCSIRAFGGIVTVVHP